MSDYTTILYEIDQANPAVCRITLNRPDKYNAIDRTMAEELIHSFRRVREEKAVGVVVLAGAGGKAFCTGGDLSVFPSLADHGNCLDWMAHQGADVGRAMAQCGKVIVGKINGHCLAGGLELALCCDLLYARQSAKMGTTEINMGILPGWGGTARIVRSMPLFRAREVIYSGRKDYTAQEMYDMGLLTRVFPDEEFEACFGEAVALIASKKPIALRMAKEVMACSTDGAPLETALAVERNGITWLVHSPDIQAFLDAYRQTPDRLTEEQKIRNQASDTR
ncbi:MAG: enoyl-CoA hydratase/isomerase family protein [Desulfatibacillaceae bacterium]|nr:enoyl-CoA hydratase/isomerase family protein [Desulfatibacillaceae bacterium]